MKIMEICEILANFTADTINASAEETQMSAWDHERTTCNTAATKVKQEKADEDEAQEYQYQQQQQQHHRQNHEMDNEVKLEAVELTESQHPSYFHSFAATNAPVVNTAFDSDCGSTPASSASFDSDLAASTSFASHQQQQKLRTDPAATAPFKYEQHQQIASSVSRILNGKFFKITREDSGDNITAVCLKCLPQMVEIKGNKKTTSNFVSHLKRRHGQKTLDEYERWKRQRRDESARPSHAMQSYYNRKHPELCGGGTAYPQHQQQTQQQQQQQQQQQHLQLQQQQQQQQNFNENLVQYVIHSLVPLREVESPYFKQLFECLGVPNVTVPTRRQMADEIDKRFDRHISIVTEHLQAANYICTTADLLWSASERCSILGVTAHWLNAGNNLQRQSAALACRRFEQRNRKKASPLTPALLEEILQKYGINQSKLVATIADNRRTYVKGFKRLGVDSAVLMSAAAHLQATAAIKREAVTRTGNGDDCGDDDDDEDDTDDEDDEVDDDDDDHDAPPPTEDVAWQAALPNSLNGSNHTLIVCLQSAFEESLRNHSALAQLHAQVIAKCNTLWKLSKHSRSARREFAALLPDGGGGQQQQTLARPVETRWNSLADALKQLWAMRDKMSAAAQALNIANPLTPPEFGYILEYLRCTEPITRALEVLQDDGEENNSYYGIVLPCILSLKHKLEALRNQSWLHCAPLIATLCDTVAARFHELTGFESAQSKKAVVASITLPRFKNRWFSLVEPTLHAHLLDILKTEAAAEQNSAAAHAQAEEPASVSYKNDDFFDFLTERSELGANSLVNTCELEVLKYLSDPDTRLNCLDNYPILRKLFIKFNTSLPSSAPAERLLPYATMIDMLAHPKRSYDDMFEKQIILQSKLSTLLQQNKSV